MNELAALGIILLLALLLGHLVKFVRVPEVTGYILAGVLVGPQGLDWVTHDSLAALRVFSQVALGLILFSIGGMFEFSRLARIGRRVLLVTSIESALAAILVFGGTLAAGLPWQPALLLGTVAIETAAASTLMVIRECNSEGPMTEILTGIIGMNNILCLLAFSLAAASLDLQATLGGGTGVFESLYRSFFPLFWQMLGGLALGYLIGVLLASWASKVTEHGEVLILLAGCLLLAVGGSLVLGTSPLITSLAVGTTMVNLSSRTHKLFEALSRTDPPLYAIFFVIAGADLNLALLPSIGVLGLIYVAGRSVGKLAGTRLGAVRARFEPVTQRLLGFSMLSQAGLAIGLVLAISQRFPQYAPLVNTIVLASVAVFELIGPVSARMALVRSGEARPHGTEPAVL